jgi:hypothetical protein
MPLWCNGKCVDVRGREVVGSICGGSNSFLHYNCQKSSHNNRGKVPFRGSAQLFKYQSIEPPKGS